MRNKLVRQILVLASALLLTSFAQAGDVSEQEKQGALADVREGNRLLDEAKPEEALARFRHAQSVVGGFKIYYNIGQALKAIPGREAQAYDAFAQFLRNVPGASSKVRESAEAQQRELLPKIALLQLRVTPQMALVSLDGESVSEDARAFPIPLRGGSHMLEASHDGFQTVHLEIDLRPGDSVERQVNLPGQRPPPAIVVAAPKPAVPPPLTADATITSSQQPEKPVPLFRRPWVWATAAGVVLAAITIGIVMSNSRSDSCSECISLPR